MVDLSIIVLSFNTKELTQQCLKSLQDALSRMKKYKAEVLVVDNNSSDGSQDMIKSLPVTPILLDENLGFGKANNVAIKKAKGTYVLFLNSDVMQQKIDYDELLDYMEEHEDVGILTARINLESGSIDPASHRGFPTVWRAVSYFAKLEKVFGNVPVLNKIFGGYHLTYLPLNTVHEIESPSGAFFLTRKTILEKVNGFDEDYFMYGEDLDLAYRIKELGYKVIYFPKASVLHLKYRSGIKTGNKAVKKRISKHFYISMEIFYNKHYAAHHSPVTNFIVRKLINLKKDSI